MRSTNLSNGRFQTRRLLQCRLRGLSDEDTSSGWDAEDEFDPVASGWAETLKTSIPHIDEDEMFMLRRIEWAVRSVVEQVGAKKTWEWHPSPGQN